MPTFYDFSGDEIVLETMSNDTMLSITVTMNGEDACVVFKNNDVSDRERVRAMVKYIQDWLGDDPRPTTVINNVAGTRASEIPFNEAALRLAAVHGRTVEFSYAKGSGGMIERRRLRPEVIETSKDGTLRFVGFDPDRQDYRAYRVDRIKGTVQIVGG